LVGRIFHGKPVATFPENAPVFARRDAWLPVVGALIALAWLTLVLWAQSPYGRFLEHDEWLRSGLAAPICRALPAGAVTLPALLYVGGWLLMTVAMMLPTVLPLLAIFARITSSRPNRGLLLGLLIAGYLSVWTAFGIVAHGADMGLHALIDGNAVLSVNGWLVGVAVLILAGLFQFSALKYRCLDKCRTPFSFVNAHWSGRAERRQSFRLGVHHGLFCVGCCWAIMLLMFVVGTGSVGWMLAIGAVMAIEKNVAWGRRLTAPLGIGLLLAAAAILVMHA
jgi:predicted metal-binding membrane protein